jgi:hypothetical protein
MSEEVRRGTLRNGARRMKRFSRYMTPTLRERDESEYSPCPSP